MYLLNKTYFKGILSLGLLLCFMGGLLGQAPLKLAQSFVEKNARQNGLELPDVQGMTISDYYRSPSTGIYHFYFQQTYKNVRVYNAIYNVAIKDGKIIHSNHTFISHIDKKVNGEIPILSAKSGLGYAANHVELDASKSNLLRTEETAKGGAAKYIFSDGDISRDEIPVELFWQVTGEGKSQNVRLAWKVIINEKRSSDWWNMRVDAETGKILAQDNFTIYCDFGHAHQKGGVCQNHHQQEEAFKAVPTIPSIFANNDYNVFDYPLESPSHGNRTIVNSPYTKFMSSRAALGATNGWHHTATNNWNYTRGNNVWSQEDENGNNGTGYSPNPGGGLDFNYPFDFYGTTAFNQDAAITNLFYWNNLTHDVLYNYGFDEPTGNFQESNVDGAGGNGGDSVFADAQDGFDMNNANFATPVDGTNPRMQMFLWSDVGSLEFDVNPPSTIAGAYGAVESNFSTNNKLSDLGPITGDLVLANNIEACNATPITNGAAINGNIAVIDRGNCNFTEKVKNAENEGAIAVVMCNNVAGSPIAMGGTDNTITIPAVMLSQSECNTIKVEMASNTVNITMTSQGQYTPDGDFDNGIIAHEYGHGWSTRTTGGPGISCLDGDERQGEGWSDFLALMLCTDWASLSPDVASANIPRGIGTYAIGQPITDGGIRPFMYSYDMANINSYAEYANVGDGATFSRPHGVGSIWCTILWDMTWEIIFQDNYIQPNIWDVSTMEGNVAAFKLVHEGMRLQPCNPGFVTSRDAILAADEALFNGKYRCSIWKAFARRGVGVNADQGSSASVTDGTPDYAIPSGVEVTKVADKQIYDQGETVNYTVTAQCNCSDENNVSIEDVLPAGLTYVTNSASGGGTESGGTITWAAANLLANSTTTYTYQATVDLGTASTGITVVNDNLSGSTPAGSWTASADWGITNNPPGTFPACNGNGYFAPDNASPSDESLVLAFTVTGPNTTLSFTHNYDTETNWDGGVIEVSENGGTKWTDLGADITANGYSGTSQSFGIPMFTGSSGGCVTTTVDLSNYCGDLQVRFRMLCDANTGGDGWIVDDINIASITGIRNDADAKQGATTVGTGCACIEVTNNIFVPVELLSLNARPLENSIQLNWATATETNNKGFDIERSISPTKGFVKIGWIEGNGNAASENNYLFEDAHVEKGIKYYYRLKQMDFDGAFEYSNTVFAKIEDRNSISLFPNPTKGTVTVQSSYAFSGKVSLIVKTIDGKEMKAVNIDAKELANGYLMDIQELSSGVYLLETRTSENSIVERLVIK